ADAMSQLITPMMPMNAPIIFEKAIMHDISISQARKRVRGLARRSEKTIPSGVLMVMTLLLLWNVKAIFSYSFVDL
ncbi:MAG: hypothetical protein ABII06_15165, partial [Pseudomonadota bacterium]